MTGQTLTEKILARAAGVERVMAGDEIWAEADVMIMNDSSGPRRIEGLVDELGGIRHPDRVVVASDHFAPASTQRHAEILRTTRRWAERKGIAHFYEYQGVLHNLVLEKELVRPGMLLVGADSHTVTAGAVGAVAVAVGSTELATVLATGQVWLRVPTTLRFELEGKLPACVDLRDVTMRLLGDHGLRYASYRAMEFGGSFVESLSTDERLVLANQGIEMGAKNAIVEPGESQRRMLEAHGWDLGLARPDADAVYEKRHRYDVTRLSPMVAVSPAPDKVVPAGELEGTGVDMAWLGSCVGGRLADLRAAATVLRGRKVRVPFLVNPNTQEVFRQATADGSLATLVEAGATILPPGCGACAGVHGGVQGPGDVVMATATRNFLGRMGSRTAQVFLGSPFTVAASAVAGRVVDPRELGMGGMQ